MTERELPAVSPPKQASENSAIRFESLRAVRERPQVEHLIPGLAIPGGVTLVLGEPKSGKSTFTAQLCLAAALGEPFLDLPPGRQLRVAILTPEQDARDYVDDLDQIGRDVYGRDKVLDHLEDRVLVSEMAFDVLAASKAELDEAVESLKKVDPDVVVLDSFYDFIDGETEVADYVGIAQRVGAIKNVARDIGCAILVVHHSRKAANTEDGSTAVAAVLGSQALAGKVDCLIWLRRNQRGWTVAVQSRSRDCPVDSWTLARPLDGQGRGFVEISETEARGLDPAEVQARLPEYAKPLTDLPEPKQEEVVAYLDKHGHGEDRCLVFGSLTLMQQAIEEAGLAEDGRRTREALIRDFPNAFFVLTGRQSHMVLMPSGLELLTRRPDGGL
jgi:KaiC/GvpD/RAD55 family RecA-like ATPase